MCASDFSHPGAPRPAAVTRNAFVGQQVHGEEFGSGYAASTPTSATTEPTFRVFGASRSAAIHENLSAN